MGSNRTMMLSGISLRQTVHIHRASVHQAPKLVAALLRVARVTAGLPPGLWLMSPAGCLPRTGISSGTLRSIIEYGLPLPFFQQYLYCTAHLVLLTTSLGQTMHPTRAKSVPFRNHKLLGHNCATIQVCNIYGNCQDHRKWFDHVFYSCVSRVSSF